MINSPTLCLIFNLKIDENTAEKNISFNLQLNFIQFDEFFFFASTARKKMNYSMGCCNDLDIERNRLLTLQVRFNGLARMDSSENLCRF